MLVSKETHLSAVFIIQGAQDIVKIRVKIRERITQLPETIDPYDEMLKSLGEMFRHFILANVKDVTNRLEVLMTNEKKAFIDAFIIIAGYSLQPDRSNRLLRVMLNVMNPNMVNRLRRGLSQRQRVMMSTTPDKLRAFTNATLKCVGEIQTPLSLQAISRNAIIHGMSTGDLNVDSLAPKNMPVHLSAYVMHEY